MWETISWFAPYLFSIVAFWCLMEQISYLKKKSHLPGPTVIFPFMGTVIPLIRNPTQYWSTQAHYATSTPLGVSSNYILGHFMVFIRSSDLSHQIFSNVRPDAFHLIGHPFGKKLFGSHNMIYLTGDAHKDIRRRIAPNFTPKALSTYSHLQQRVILNHLISWERPNIKLRLLVRDMNLDTSQTVFVGPYLDSDSRSLFNSDYSLFNLGLMKLPVDLPGFAFRNARLAVDRLVSTLASCAEASKIRMAAGVAPTCLIDFWMQDELASPSGSSSEEIGGHLFDFLFAAQDASSSSLLWAVTLLDSHPEVLAKVREEVAGIWWPESGSYITAEQLSAMKYTHAVAREVLRYRAPATLVPHIAGEDFALTKNYTIPKGAIVFPSVYESSFQGFPEPDRFDPDRFMEGRLEDQKFRRNFLVFGAGAHQCVGQRYAINHLVLFISMFTSLMDFKRHRSDGCDEIMYVPTICPKDECLVSISRRVGEYPKLL